MTEQFKRELRETLIPSLKRMVKKETAHLAMLHRRKADPAMIAESEKWLRFYIQRLVEYQQAADL